MNAPDPAAGAGHAADGRVCRDPPDQAQLRQLADEQAALRRVATLVARGAAPDEVFTAVAEEVGQLFRVELATLFRYEPGPTATTVTTWGPAGKNLPVGIRWPVDGHNVTTLVFETGRPARVDRYPDSSSGPLSAVVRETGIRSAVGTPVIVEGSLWGAIFAGSTLEQPLPPDTETRLASFTELVATAIANTGIHPAILSEGGLTPALKALARRSAVPVELDLRTGRRLPGPVEVAAYYAVSEALANAAKHARASVVHVEVDALDATLRLTIRDDGIGGADPARGSGLTGLRDRIEAVGGTFNVTSPDGGGTTLLIEIPV